MDVLIVAALGGKYVVVRHGVRSVLADVDRFAVDPCHGRSIDEAVDERGVGILVDLLDISGYLCGLCPVVVLHCNDKDVRDLAAVSVILVVIAFLSDGTGRCKRSKHGEPCERAKWSDIQHVVPRGWGNCEERGRISSRIFSRERQPSTLRFEIRSRRLLRSDDGQVKDRREYQRFVPAGGARQQYGVRSV